MAKTKAPIETDDFWKKDRDPKIAALIKDEEMVVDSGNFWVVLIAVGGFLAAWIDENGKLCTAERKSQNGAIKLASGSWGR